MTQGMMYFPRMLDKIRMHARGELGADYLSALGQSRRMDGACSHFLRVKYADLRDRVLAGGTDEEILEWCYETGRRLDARDLTVWNAFVSKLGWNDFAHADAGRRKTKAGH